MGTLPAHRLPSYKVPTQRRLLFWGSSLGFCPSGLGLGSSCRAGREGPWAVPRPGESAVCRWENPLTVQTASLGKWLVSLSLFLHLKNSDSRILFSIICFTPGTVQRGRGTMCPKGTWPLSMALTGQEGPAACACGRLCSVQLPHYSSPKRSSPLEHQP